MTVNINNGHLRIKCKTRGRQFFAMISPWQRSFATMLHHAALFQTEVQTANGCCHDSSAGGYVLLPKEESTVLLGVVHRDVVHRMNEGYRAWGALKSVLNNRGLWIKTNKCLYDGVIVPTALYGAEA